MENETVRMWLIASTIGLNILVWSFVLSGVVFAAKWLVRKISLLARRAFAAKSPYAVLKERADRLEGHHESLVSCVADLMRHTGCAEDYGHEYVFVRHNGGRILLNGGVVIETFTYKCSRCGRTVDYTWDELSTKEKNALKTLGMVKP